MTSEAGKVATTSRRDLLLALGAGTATSAIPAFAQQSSDESARLRSLLDRSAISDQEIDLLSDTQVGRGKARIASADPLGDAYAVALRSNKECEWRLLQAIDRGKLPSADQIAYDVFAVGLRQVLHRFETGLFEVQRQTPFNPSSGLHVTFPDYLSSTRNETVADIEQRLVQLQVFADFLGSAVTQAKRGLARGYCQPRVLVKTLLRQIDALLAIPIESGPFLSSVRSMDASIDGSSRDRLTRAWRQVVEDEIYPGYQRWQGFLRETYLPFAESHPGRWAMKGGEELYAWELARHTTTSATPDQLHGLGLAEVSRIASEMEKVRTVVGFAGDLKAFFEFVRSDSRFYCKTSDELLQRFKTIEARIWPAVGKLFHQRPKAPFKVAPLPALGGQRGTGYYRAGEPDGVSPGILFFNMSMLDTRPIPTLETLTLHEGIPGHHFQIMLARENKELPRLLRFGSVTAFSEGWGLYAESLGPELGMFTDPMQMFGHLDMEMLRAVRLVVDTGIHAKRWDRQKAIDYMLSNTSMAARDVAVEIDRYIAMPGQACAYKVGELKIRELRKKAEKQLGARFDVRDFHSQVLDTGSLPLDVLEAKVDRWIGRGGSRSTV